MLSLLFCVAPVSAAPAEVVLQLPWKYQFQFAGYLMALEKGYYEEAGLKVEIRDIQSGRDPVTEVLSGRADFGISGSGLVVERSLGKPIVAIAAILQEAPTIFLTLASSGINSPQDFVGKRVMLSPGYTSLPLLALLQQENLLNEIIRVPTSFSYQSLLNGETDVFNGYLSNEPFLLESQGRQVNVIDPREYGIHFYSDVLFTREHLQNINPDQVEKFRLASIKGWHYALDHISETASFIQRNYRPDKNLDSLVYEASVLGSLIVREHGDIGHMDVARWAQITHHLIAIGELEANFNLEDEFIYQPPLGINWRALESYIVIIGLVIFGLLVFLFLLSRANYKVKKALAQLEVSEQRYRELVDRVPGLIYSFQMGIGGICFSSHLEDVLGITLEQFRQQPQLWYNAIHPEDRKVIDSVFMTMKAGETNELEYRIQHSNGDWLWFQDRFSSRLTSDNQLLVDGVAVDITEKKHLQQKQKQLDQLLQKALDAVSDGVWEWHVGTNDIVLDQRSRELFGINGVQDLKFDDLFALVDHADLVELRSMIQAHLEGRSERIDYIFKVRRSNGSIVWLRGRGRILERDENGKPLRLIGTFVDATKGKLAEAKRLESEARFRLLIEQVSRIAIQGYNEQRQVVFWNKASEELYGYSEEEALGRQLEDLIIPAEMKEHVIAGIAEWLETGIAIPAEELTLVGKDGEDVQVFSSHILHQTAEGKELYCIDVDMRPIKEAEKKRVQLEEQLRQVYKMEAIGTMAGGIAHDFNNSLAIILGNVELSLLKIPANSPLKNYLNNAKATILRAKDLVQKILLYSRQGIQNKGNLVLADHLNDLISMLRSTIPATIDVRLTISDSAATARVSADPTQLQQILINLCNNSVQAMLEKGRLEISMDLVDLNAEDLPKGRALLPGRYAWLAVNDTGCGIEPETLDRIFDPFFTTKEIGKGTGMGLAVVQGIVESHDGFIIADSEAGKGARFSVYLPLCDSQPLDATPAAEPDGDLPQGHENILIVDDEEALLEVSGQWLQEYGYQVSAVNSAKKALDLFRLDPERFALVITDQTMPDMTGQELAAELLKLKPELPVVLCSGYSVLLMDQEVRQQGICAYLQKPLDLADLTLRIRSILDGGEG